MQGEATSPGRVSWAAVSLAGAGLFLFLRLTHAVPAALPATAGAAREWADAAGTVAPWIEAALAVLVAAALRLAQRTERPGSLRGALHAGVLMSLPAAAALVGLGASAGVAGYGALRGALAVLGVVGTSVLLHRMTRRP